MGESYNLPVNLVLIFKAPILGERTFLDPFDRFRAETSVTGFERWLCRGRST